MQLCVTRHVSMVDYVLDQISVNALQSGLACSVKYVSNYESYSIYSYQLSMRL